MIPLRDTTPRRRTPWVTWGLIALNVFLFLQERAMPPRLLANVVDGLGLVPARFSVESALDPFRYLPLFTSQFLHGGWLHLIGNMLYLWIFADNVEDLLGHGRFLAFYLACGALAGVGQVLSAPLSQVPMIGASGAIAGVLGAYFTFFPRARVVTLVPVFFLPWLVEIPAFVFLGIWFVFQLFDGLATLGLGSGVAFWAHAAGFLSGLLLVHLFVEQRRLARA
jgi:membrane associated rhomboid family serine protease